MKNKVLMTITKLMACLLFLSLSAIESESVIPVIGLAVSMSWILLFSLVNKEIIEKW